MSHPHATAPEKLDLREKGASGQASDKRLFMQLQVYTGCKDPKKLADALQDSGLEAVLYLDLSDPQGAGVLFMSEDPGDFTGPVRSLLTAEPFASLRHRRRLTMTGRTYSTGFESDLEDWLLARNRRNVSNHDWPWAIWYPLRRKPEFALLEPAEQGKVLREHGLMGRTYGEAGYATDVRLACHGLDANDNEFIIGVLGPELHPLSRLIQDMRKSQQTAKHIQSLGPFFIGKVLWRSRISKPTP